MPEPHPLDFDWRYTAGSVSDISNLVPAGEAILTMGAPSLARHFEKAGQKVILVDRQPFQCVENHLKVDINDNPPPISGFRVAVVDPPWYPFDVKAWVAWAAKSVGVNGTVFVSIWPPKTRPNAETEYRGIADWISEWAELAEMETTPHYEAPLFEKLAVFYGNDRELSQSPRIGRLLKISVRATPSISGLPLRARKWQRFVFNDYQLAVRSGGGKSKTAKLSPLPNVENWHWPFVSKRAPERNLIDIWSSRNEVGMLSEPSALIRALRAASAAENGTSFEKALEIAPELLQWHLPRPPYWRTHEWSHHQ